MKNYHKCWPLPIKDCVANFEAEATNQKQNQPSFGSLTIQRTKKYDPYKLNFPHKQHTIW